jgi:8-oxo-dGTP pyrophosphatase MutT (NUDIX family)
MPIFANPPHEVVFVERARHLRRHAGEIAFPGGAIDDEDGGDHERAALREVHEEVGLAPDAVSIVSRLQPIRQRINRFIVTPFVGVVTAGSPLVVDANEADAAHRVPLAAIVEPGAVHRGIHHAADYDVDTYLFDYGSLHVWGLTGRILHAFIERYADEHSPLRRALDRQLTD